MNRATNRTQFRIAASLASLMFILSLFLTLGHPTAAAADAGRIIGTVTDSATGFPVDAVCVTVGPPIRCWVYTNAAGQYAIDIGINGATWDLYFLKAGQYSNFHSPNMPITGIVTYNVQMVHVPGAVPPAVPAPTEKPVQTPPPVTGPTAPPVATPPPATLGVEQRIANFWNRINGLNSGDAVSSTDLGQWALNVIERNPKARLTAAAFRASTAGMQGGLDRAGLAPVNPSAPAPSSTVEQRIADFWTRMNALAPSDFVSAADLGAWALNVIDRNSRAQLIAADFRSSTAGMQGGFDAAGLAP